MPAGRVAPRYWPDGFSRDLDLVSDDPATHRFLRTHHVYVPFWMLTLAFAARPTSRLLTHWRTRARRAPHHCPRCGYDCRATPTQCPECGTTLPPQPPTPPP